MNDQDWLKNVDPRMGNYIAGFTDGEGSFNVSLKKRTDYKNIWKVSASFNISQKDKAILALFKNVLGCGNLRERKDGIVYLEVNNIAALRDRIIPFFRKFGFLSSRKKTNFSIFQEIVDLISKGEHLNPQGFKNIVQLREKINEGIGRTRKYTLLDVIK